jgi:hypothetical protein
LQIHNFSFSFNFIFPELKNEIMKNIFALLFFAFISIMSSAQENKPSGNEQNKDKSGKDGNQDKQDIKYTEGASGVRRSIHYKFSIIRSDSDPGTGIFRYDNDNVSKVNWIYVDNNDLSGDDQTNWYSTWDKNTGATARGSVSVVEYEGKNVIDFDFTDVFTDGSGYWKFPVKYVSGAMPADGAVYYYVFNRIDHNKEQADKENQGNSTDHENQGNNTEHENQGNNTDHENQGNDTDHENQGNNTAQVNQGNNTEHENQGNDTAQVNQGNNTEHENQGNDTAQVNQGNNTEHENQGNNTDHENQGNDTEHENQGNNTDQENNAAQIVTVTQESQPIQEPQPVQVTPPTPEPQPVQVTQPTPEPQPVQVTPPTPEPQPVLVTPPTPEPQPVQVTPPTPEPQPVQVTPPTPEPQPAQVEPAVKEQPPAEDTQLIQKPKPARTTQTTTAKQTTQPTQTNQPATPAQIPQPSPARQTTQPAPAQQTTQVTQPAKPAPERQTTPSTPPTQPAQTTQATQPAQTKPEINVTNTSPATQTGQYSNIPASNQYNSNTLPNQSNIYEKYLQDGGRSRGKCYSGIIEIGYALGVGNYGINNFRFNFINGFKIGKVSSIGLGIGYRRYFDENETYTDRKLVSGNQMPVFLDLRTNFSTRKVTPYLAIGLGGSAGLDTSESKQMGLYFCPSGGIWFNLSNRLAIFGGVAYELQKLEYVLISDDSHIKKNTSSISLNIGISF